LSYRYACGVSFGLSVWCDVSAAIPPLFQGEGWKLVFPSSRKSEPIKNLRVTGQVLSSFCTICLLLLASNSRYLCQIPVTSLFSGLRRFGWNIIASCHLLRLIKLAWFQRNTAVSIFITRAVCKGVSPSIPEKKTKDAAASRSSTAFQPDAAACMLYLTPARVGQGDAFRALASPSPSRSTCSTKRKAHDL
jgi:hypothetical protein